MRAKKITFRRAILYKQICKSNQSVILRLELIRLSNIQQADLHPHLAWEIIKFHFAQSESDPPKLARASCLSKYFNSGMFSKRKFSQNIFGSRELLVFSPKVWIKVSHAKQLGEARLKLSRSWGGDFISLSAFNCSPTKKVRLKDPISGRRRREEALARSRWKINERYRLCSS